MNEIERVARAICEQHIRFVRRWDTSQERIKEMLPAAVDHSWRDFTDQATAAIAAMRGEPVGWLYTQRDGTGSAIMTERMPYPSIVTSKGWTETALYAGPTPPDSGKD
jgi:hypothetical protein